MEPQPEKTGVCFPNQSQDQSLHRSSSPQEYLDTILPLNSHSTSQISTIVETEMNGAPDIPLPTGSQPDIQDVDWPILPISQQPKAQSDDWPVMPTKTTSLQTQPKKGIDVSQRKRYYHIILIVTVEQEEAIVDLFKHKQWEYMKAGQEQTHEDIQEMCAKMQGVNPNAHSSDLEIETKAQQDIIKREIEGSTNSMSDSDTLSIPDEMKEADNDYVQVKLERKMDTEETCRDYSMIGESGKETGRKTRTRTLGSKMVSKPHVLGVTDTQIKAKKRKATKIKAKINNKKDDTAFNTGVPLIMDTALNTGVPLITDTALNTGVPLITDQSTNLLHSPIKPTQSVTALETGVVGGSTMLRLGIRCENCETIFSNKMEFQNHLTSGKCIWVCTLCQKVYASSYRTFDKDYIYSIFNEKLDQHKKECDQTCKLCGQSFGERANLLRHIKHRHSDDKKFACDVCFFTFKSENSLHLHKITKHTDTSGIYRCPFCPKVYYLIKSLSDHLDFSHGCQKKHERYCSICGKKCNSMTIKNHEETHRPKDISCDQCPAMFNTQQGLKDHQRRHRKDYSHFCELCAKGFYTVSALDNHRRMHTGEKPYSCSLCEYSCSIKGNLAKHMKVHGKQTSGLQQ